MRTLKQIGALPYVETQGGLLVLLITTRGLGRWTIPKGWPKPGLTDSEMAEREAFEEAGITGDIAARPIADFLYLKRLHAFAWAKCRVEVYPLRTRCQHLAWPEQASRRSVWMEPGQAAAKVGRTQLARVLRAIDSSVTALQ